MKNERIRIFGNFMSAAANSSLPNSDHFVPMCLCAYVPSFRRAFTLVELMVVMVVISVMVGITIPISKYVTLRARQANQKIYIERIKSALEDYRAAYGEYPITPSTNQPGGVPVNYSDSLRHYDKVDCHTKCFPTTNSPFLTFNITTNTVESITTADQSLKVDYCLTYPLMLKQLENGARPFMDFKEVTVAYLVFDATKVAGDTYMAKRKRKTKGGGTATRTTYGVWGNPVNRLKAIDPVSQNQWKYTSEDGVTYSLTMNSF